jgi:hypothetical protein
MQKLTQSPNSVPLWGDEEWELVAPLILLMQITKLFVGVTCDHSLGGSQVSTMFYKYLFKKGVLLGSQMLQIRQISTEYPPICSQTCTKQQANNDKRWPKTLWKCLWLLV